MERICFVIMPFSATKAQIIGETGDNILSTWSQRIKPLNEASLGSDYPPMLRVQFPDPIDSTVPNW